MSTHDDLKDVQVQRVPAGADVFSYIDVGAGKPVVFLHGALGDLRTWQRHCLMLSDRFRCIAYTQRYFGQVPWQAGGPPFGIATHADDLIAFVRALNLGPVNLVAWSYAGHAALHAALQEPNLFQRLFLYEPGVRTIPMEPEDLAAFSQDAEAMFGPIFAAVQKGHLTQAVRLLIDASGYPGYFDQQPPEVRTIHLGNAHTMPLLLAQEPPPPTTCEALSALTVPVMVAWGQQSRPVSKLPSMAVARCLRAGQSREVPGVGHLWPETHPEAFTDAVRAWLGNGG